MALKVYYCTDILLCMVFARSLDLIYGGHMAAALHSRCSYWLVAANRLDDNSVESRAEARTNNDNHAVGPQITLNRPHNLYLSLSGDVRYDIMPFSASQFTLETANTYTHG